MNRLNKAILFGLVSAICGASSVNGVDIKVDGDFYVASNTETAVGKVRKKSLINGTREVYIVDGEQFVLKAETIHTALNAVLQNATTKKITYSAYQTSEAKALNDFSEDNKKDIATIYACWLINVKKLTDETAISTVNKKDALKNLADKTVVQAFYKLDLLNDDFSKYATPDKYAPSTKWAIAKKSGKYLVVALAATAVATGAVKGYQNYPLITQKLMQWYSSIPSMGQLYSKIPSSQEIIQKMTGIGQRIKSIGYRSALVDDKLRHGYLQGNADNGECPAISTEGAESSASAKTTEVEVLGSEICSNPEFQEQPGHDSGWLQSWWDANTEAFCDLSPYC